MILAVDVNYDQKRARAAGVLFSNWTAAQPYSKFISILDEVKEYIPGEFYKRELPCILKLINEHKLRPQIIIVDGYVYLDGNTKPGLGKYLFDQLNGKIPSMANLEFRICSGWLTSMPVSNNFLPKTLLLNFKSPKYYLSL